MNRIVGVRPEAGVGGWAAEEMAVCRRVSPAGHWQREGENRPVHLVRGQACFRGGQGRKWGGSECSADGPLGPRVG